MILWNLQCFSIPLLFGIMGMVWARRMYIPSLIMAFGAIFVFNRYEYLYSWDIVKFTQVAWIPLSIFAAGFIAHVLTHSRYSLRIAFILPAVSLVMASMGFLWQSGTEGFQVWKEDTNVGNHTALWMELPGKTSAISSMPLLGSGRMCKQARLPCCPRRKGHSTRQSWQACRSCSQDGEIIHWDSERKRSTGERKCSKIL